jgi:hypothetical protein
MRGRRADRKLHLELLRARGAAERIELSLATQAISDAVAPLRRASDSIGSIGAAIGSSGRPLRWLATAAGALMEARWTRKAVTRAVALLRSGAVPGARIAVLGVLGVAAVAMLTRRRRRSTESEPDPQPGSGDETS